MISGGAGKYADIEKMQIRDKKQAAFEELKETASIMESKGAYIKGYKCR